ncbi:S8 family serine peptidase [Shewanella baltica]|uniref:S8 family serine peptidase n=1 Tax=Shewanella baltica TaxID=62322 RepID=UPI0028716C3F|nr:S8 family serine peptidase [Shewanella baltica]MDR9764761.1 S8 family serine peptidase [Shewanella baltica]
MKNKIALAVSAALLSMGASAGSVSHSAANITVNKPSTRSDQIKIQHTKEVVPIAGFTQAVFIPEADLAPGKYRYFVRLIDNPVALYNGEVEGFKATNLEKTHAHKLNVKSAEVKSYRSYLERQQVSFITKAKSVVGELNVQQKTTLAFNGMVVEMSQDDAIKLAKVPGVAHIKRETLRYVQTDSGPNIIKAPTIWSGEATGVATKGEGMIVGIIDTGVNTDHPSFADMGGDGYDHTNPWGENNYIGDCKTNFPELCNDKLIGVYSWPEVTKLYLDHDVTVPANGEDHNGHGSHTASTSAGNVLVNQAVPDADGKDSGVVFEQVSGVAPHANIVSYQVCLPGEDDAVGFHGCLPSLTVLAVENAIENGIDVLNYSIGGGSSDPWQDADALAFLAARKAGIHVATSAGNDGPGASTVGSPGDAPWITTVAAYTHDRDFSDKTLDGFTGGDTPVPDALKGKAMTGAYSGKIVYAGNYTNANDPSNDPAQCLKPFPADTFAAETIVVCDRGTISRVDKGRNVKAGGAAALVLANITGGADSVVADAHVLPAIQIDTAQGNKLRAWLASGEGHRAAISGSEVIHDDKLARIAAEFTSRGPNKSVPNVIAPSIAAPGVNIFAAYADSQSAGFKELPDPNNFGFLSGTSMASPHIAGALTLLAKIHPTWTPAEVQSALMLTANQNTMKEDGKTPSDFFDMGAGFANLEAAAKTGLVMDETYAGYLQSNPAVGGKPEAINLPTMANATCVDKCSWTRIVKATVAGSWKASAIGMVDGFALTVSPTEFVLAAGETKELTITADVSAADKGWNFANIKLMADNLPEVKLPVAVKAEGNNLPNSFELEAGRTKGSMTYSGFAVKGQADISINVYDKSTYLVEPTTLKVPDDDLDYVAVTFPEDVPNVQFKISSATAPDVDLRILDSSFVKIGASAGSDSNEVVSFTDLAAGQYYVVVDGYTASAPGAVDDVLLEISSVLFDKDSLSDTVMSKVSESEGELSITFDWDTAENAAGILAALASDGSLIKQMPFKLTHKADVNVAADLSDAMVAGEASRVSFNIEPNLTSEDKVYTLEALLSQGHEITNISHNGVLSNTNVKWSVTQPAGSAEIMSVGFDLIPRKSGEFFGINLSNTLGDDTVETQRQFGVIQVAPVADASAPAKVKEGAVVAVSGKGSSDANNDALTYKWVQTAGTGVSFDATASEISFTAPPAPPVGETLTFELTVADGHGNMDAKAVSVMVENTPDNGGGSLGWLSLLMLPVVWLRRKVK